MRFLCNTTAYAYVMFAISISAQQQLTPNARDTVRQLPKVDVELQLSTSRAQPTAGTGLGVTARITNISTDTTVYLRESDMTLTLPPELEGPFIDATGWYAYFPTEPHPNDAVGNGTIAITPGHSYQVVWSRNPFSWDASQRPASGLLRNVWRQIATELRFVFFSPGDYKMIVQAKYFLDRDMKATYRVVEKDVSVAVSAPQFVILLGAAIGGLIAFIIFPQRRNVAASGASTAWQRFGMATAVVVGAVGACLLSAIVTILLARVSETQFLVRITINDFWGAIAVGFIAAYAGNSVLDRIVPTGVVRERIKITSDTKVTTTEKGDTATDDKEHAESDIPDAAGADKNVVA